MTELSQALGVAAGRDDGGDRRRDLQRCRHLPRRNGRRIAAAFNQSTSRPTGIRAARFARCGTLSGADRLEAYLDIFCTEQQDKPARPAHHQGHPDKPIPTCARGCPASRIASGRCSSSAAPSRRATAAPRCSPSPHAVIERYPAEKNRRGLLDYDDLIDKTLDLLNNVSAAWVHYKLDRGIDHVLIDEAQDTSPEQWEIVKALVGEFFAGAGRARRGRARSSRSATRSSRSSRSRARRRREFARNARSLRSARTATPT